MTDETKEADPSGHGLDQTALLSLVRQGKASWNVWAEFNSDVAVDFSNMNFEDSVSFAGFQFPGDAVFREATFSGSTDFEGTTFTCNAYFVQATFTRIAIFREATFTGTTHFNRVTFSGSVDFNEATFSNYALFTKAKFKGHARFRDATFTGDASFTEAKFLSNTGFEEAKFLSNAGFIGATFTGYTDLGDAMFKCDAKFGGATFAGNSGFAGARFLSNADFQSIDVQVRIDFSGSSFHGIPGFQTAKNRDRILVENVVFTLPRPEAWVPRIIFWLTGIRGLNTSVIARIRQLRAIANDTNDIDAERDLAILERNAEVGVAWSGLKELWPFRQWTHSVLTTLFSTPLLILYRWTSDYGRSIKLPLFWLVTTPFLWFAVHFKLYLLYGTTGRYLLSDEEFNAIKSITLFGAFPVSATQRPAYTAAVENLSGGSTSADLPFALQVSLTLQSITSLVFLFLIGLALRNFFRMK